VSAAGSGLLLPSLDTLIASAARSSGVTAVLAAADRVHNQIEDAEYRASFAPPPEVYACCPCGSVMEIHGELDAEEYDAIRDWEYGHADCGGEL
jgi:hypothetical protein